MAPVRWEPCNLSGLMKTHFFGVFHIYNYFPETTITSTYTFYKIYIMNV